MQHSRWKAAHGLLLFCGNLDYVFVCVCFVQNILFSFSPSQIDLKGDISTTPVTGLSPKTEYSLTVYAIYPGRIGESATIITETSACQTVYTL